MSSGRSRTRGVVLVHGGFHGSWCWAPVAGRLDDLGVPLRIPDLPMASLSDDVETARGAVDVLARETGLNVVLAGHSYGGIVLSAQAPDAPISHLAFIAAVAAQAGESVVDVVNSDPGEQSALATVTEIVDGWMRPLPGPIADVLYHDCAAADTDGAVAQLRPQALECVTAASPEARWMTVPSTYVVCDDDRALPPAAQRRMARRAGATTVSVRSGHSVFYTHPEIIADVLFSIARD